MPAGSPTASSVPGPQPAVVVATEAPSAPEPGSVRVLVFNDHPVFRSGFAWKITRESGVRVVADASSLHEMLSMAEGELSDRIDAVVADLRVGDGNSEGIESVRTLVLGFSGAPVIVCTDFYSSSFAGKMAEAGASALIQKSATIECVVDAVLDAVANTRAGRKKPARPNGSAA